jgi:acetoin utilization deacetylase AcuC-like enzyme
VKTMWTAASRTAVRAAAAAAAARRGASQQGLATAVLTHPSFRDHVCGPAHPESPLRIVALQDGLREEHPADTDDDHHRHPRRLVWLDTDDAVPRATAAQLVAAGHPRAYVENMLEIFATARRSGRSVQIDSDTAVSPGTGEAALRAAGAAVAAVDLVLSTRKDGAGGSDDAGDIATAFCLTRPPGHHAEASTAMGFCFFGNVATAVAHARAAHGVRKVAVLDWDVHHGNGTQDLLWDDPDSLFVSLHQSPLYPGTGRAEETGAHDNVVNLPLPMGTGGDAFRDLMTSVVVPRVRAFRPELLVVSAGFDAHRRDPLAGLNFEANDFAFATEALLSHAGDAAPVPAVFCLEGGYDIEALVESVGAVLEVLVARSDTRQ